MRIDILGTPYTVQELSAEKCPYLKDCDGFCDKTSKRIVVAQKKDDCDLEDYAVYRNKCMRHEIIHAFLFESGLHENWEHKQYGHEETMIDWVAVQFPKLFKAFKEAGCI